MEDGLGPEDPAPAARVGVCHATGTQGTDPVHKISIKTGFRKTCQYSLQATDSSSHACKTLSNGAVLQGKNLRRNGLDNRNG